MEKLTYAKINHSNYAIIIDLHNGFSVIAISGMDSENNCYVSTLYLKDNTIDRLELIEDAEALKFHANYKTINSAILKWVGTHLEDGTIGKYIDRYLYETRCFDMGNDIMEKVRFANVS